MTAAELGLMLWLGEDVPLGDTGLQPGAAFGARARLRPVALAGIEVGVSSGPRGADFVLDGLGFLGEPVGDVVAVAFLGAGVRLGAAPRVLVDGGLGVDLVLAPVLDLHPEARVTWSPDDRVSILLNVGVSLHLPRRFDRDADGVGDRGDRCVDVPEDRDGEADADGCPDPDDDQDGVPDVTDSCRSTPEDRDGFLDEDGCPEPDNDGDGLVDDRDACINAAEDLDGARDFDGCPDLDNDADRVNDTDDACPNVPEDADAFEDADGCPDPDNDGDGVGDRFDLAPNEAENINFFADTDGAPEVLPAILRKVLGNQPRFRFDGSRLAEAGTDRAELLAAALLEYPEVRVRIRVFDPDADRAGKRAVAIAAAVVAQGVVAERLEPEGAEGAAETVVDLLP